MDANQARDLYRQVLDLRELLEAVARELERLAASGSDPERRGGLRVKTWRSTCRSRHVF
jgi:predicted component of type VI protein secretion system